MRKRKKAARPKDGHMHSNHKKTRQKKTKKDLFKKIRPYITKRNILFGMAILVGIFAIINLVLFFGFKNQTYPKTQINSYPVGSVNYLSLSDSAQKATSGIQEIKLTADQKEYATTLNDAGIKIDTSPPFH